MIFYATWQLLSLCSRSLQRHRSKDIVYPNLQQCLSICEASGDREHLNEWLPDTKKMKLWVVSHSVLSMYNYSGDGYRHFSETWLDNPKLWDPWIEEAAFGVRVSAEVLGILDEVEKLWRNSPLAQGDLKRFQHRLIFYSCCNED